MERLISVLKIKPEKSKFLYIATLDEEAKTKGIEFARFFRRQGVESLIEFVGRSLKNQMSRANKLGAAWVLIVGEEEIRKGLYQLKDMATGTQKESKAEDLLKIICEST